MKTSTRSYRALALHRSLPKLKLLPPLQVVKLQLAKLRLKPQHPLRRPNLKRLRRLPHPLHVRLLRQRLLILRLEHPLLLLLMDAGPALHLSRADWRQSAE